MLSLRGPPMAEQPIPAISTKAVPEPECASKQPPPEESSQYEVQRSGDGPSSRPREESIRLESEYNITEVRIGHHGGRISLFYNNWKKITHDTNILSMIRGIKFEFCERPVQNLITPPYKFDSIKTHLIDEEIRKFEKDNIIEQCAHSDSEIISKNLCRPK